MSPELGKLLTIIEDKLGWGESKTWQGRDFENLNQLILDKTGVSLSGSTLRRLWGKVEYKHLPSATTLDTIAKFADYENWRGFLKQNTDTISEVSSEESIEVKPVVKSFSVVKFILIAAVIVTIGLVGVYAIRKVKQPVKPGEYSFSSRPVTRQIPNSVIFTYDATASPTDSVFIQQSWDMRTRVLADKKLHQQTSVYYEPGFYKAKLIINDQVVKEHPLIIPTNGWLGLISQKMVPVYLEPGEFIKKDSLQLSVQVIETNNIPMEPMPPTIKYYSVGNFEPVSLADFSFSAEIKNEYSKGSGACQFSNIVLITDAAPIIIPVSAIGCVSDISLRSVDEVISGKTNDLSGFGADFSKWVQVSCKNAANKIQYFVNGKLAYETVSPSAEVKIVGLLFAFQGTGAVKNITLTKGDKIIYHPFGLN
jgi:hypothetical protein